MVSWFPKNSIFKMFSANCWNKAGFRKCSDTKSYWNSFKYHLKPTSNLSLMYLPFNTRTDSQVVVHKSLLVWVFAISCCMRSRKDSIFGSNRRHTTCVKLGWVAKRWKKCLDFGGYLISTKVSASSRKCTQDLIKTESQVDPSFQLKSTCEWVNHLTFERRGLRYFTPAFSVTLSTC